MDIKVQVHTPGGEIETIEAPSDIKAGELIRELTSALNLPREDADGHQISWTIDNKDTGKTLKDESTLEECGVRAGHHLAMRRNVTAGSAALQ